MPQATAKQQEYLAILLNDCGHGTTKARKAFMTHRAGRPISFADELTVGEVSKMIDELKASREDSPEPFEEPWEAH